MVEQPRFISMEVSTASPDIGEFRFIFSIFDTYKKKSLRGVKKENQDRVDLKYERVETIVGEVNEAYPDVKRRVEERLSALNAQESK
jgi:hypothetical protein